jgi:hypothetical protein
MSKDLADLDHDLDQNLAAPEDEEAELKLWWAHLPDFIKPDYPFDMPPARLPFACHVFTKVGAPRFCPEGACRRSGACRGGDGPPCFRADREALGQVLFLWWMSLFADLPYEEYEAALSASRYAPAKAPARGAGARGKRRP